jgi:hypothetical protein
MNQRKGLPLSRNFSDEKQREEVPGSARASLVGVDVEDASRDGGADLKAAGAKKNLACAGSISGRGARTSGPWR